jgi:hypothetical protein
MQAVGEGHIMNSFQFSVLFESVFIGRSSDDFSEDNGEPARWPLRSNPLDCLYVPLVFGRMALNCLQEHR